MEDVEGFGVDKEGLLSLGHNVSLHNHSELDPVLVSSQVPQSESGAVGATQTGMPFFPPSSLCSSFCSSVLDMSKPGTSKQPPHEILNLHVIQDSIDSIIMTLPSLPVSSPLIFEGRESIPGLSLASPPEAPA